MDYKISVISPCYNSENTLERCVESIISQSIGFENIQLILYDDASKDNTRNIIKSYSQKYDNIIPIYSNTNHGPGFGKDLAIEKSTGKYLMFIDSDDKYDEKMCENLLNEITEDIDVVSCNYVNIFNSSDYEFVYLKVPDYKFKEKTFLKHDELIYLDSFHVVDKLFKREIIFKNNIRFTSLRNGEDELFLRHYLFYSKNLVHLNNYFGYIIYKQLDSISNSQTVEDLFTYIFVCKKIIKLYENSDANFSKLVESRINSFIHLLYFTDILNNYNKDQLYDALESLADFEEEISFNRNLGLMNNIANFLIRHHHFKLVVVYSKILYKIRKSKFILGIYRHVTQ